MLPFPGSKGSLSKVVGTTLTDRFCPGGWEAYVLHRLVFTLSRVE